MLSEEKIRTAVESYFTAEGGFAPITYKEEMISMFNDLIQNGDGLARLSFSFDVLQEGFDFQITAYCIPTSQSIRITEEMYKQFETVDDVVRQIVYREQLADAQLRRLWFSKYREAIVSLEKGYRARLDMYQFGNDGYSKGYALAVSDLVDKYERELKERYDFAMKLRPTEMQFKEDFYSYFCIDRNTGWEKKMKILLEVDDLLYAFTYN